MALKLPENPSGSLEFGRGENRDSGIEGVEILITTISSGAPELIVRPFGFQQPLIDRLIALRPIPGESSEAEIRWGAKSKFNIQQDIIPAKEPITVNVLFDDEEPLEKKTIIFEERFRKTEDVRIENPEDEDQFVIVQRILSITFLGPDGICRQFDLNPPEVKN